MESEESTGLRSSSDFVAESEKVELKTDLLDLHCSSEPVTESEDTETKTDCKDPVSSSAVVIDTEQSEVKEDFVELSLSSDFLRESVQNNITSSGTEPGEVNARVFSSTLKEDTTNEKNMSQGIEEGEIEDEQSMELVSDLDREPLVSRESVTLVGTLKVEEKINGAVGANGCLMANKDYSSIDKHNTDKSPCSGLKRARTTYVDQEPSVHVVYKSLTRASQRKLEELLQQWSQWHAKQFMTNDPNEALESGEQTFFPALHFGAEKASTVTYWIDNQTNSEQDDYIPLDGDTVPMYDRGFALGLTSDDGSNMDGKAETGEASRCFNCGSYSHALKDCQKPRDNVAIDSARKQHNSKRAQTSGPRNSPRYYQNTAGGKYDGIRAGVLSSETRQLLGLGELDPPPWLQRMRELGYPPGYLDPDYEDQPSGITVYADEKTDGEENGELVETKSSEPKKKMTAEFPGINTPIPENADESRWASLPETSNFDALRNRTQSFHNRSSEVSSYGDRRRSQDYRDDGPPGCNPRVDFDSPRHSGYDSNYSSDTYSPVRYPAPTLGRSLSDRGRWNHPVHNGSPGNSPYSPLLHNGSPGNSPHSPASYASPITLQQPQGYNSASSESWKYGSRHNPSSDSSRRSDRHDHHRQRR